MTIKYSTLPDDLRAQFRIALQKGKQLRIIEAHSGLSALIGCTSRASSNNVEFDGLWISSLTCAVSHGLPDMELYAMDRRLDLVTEVAQLTNKPIIVDADTGSSPAMLRYLCSHLEGMGVSAVVIEDKVFPKRNSLSEESNHTLEDPRRFMDKIRVARTAIKSPDFLFFARLESLISGASIGDAIDRTRIYVSEGIDGIMIHSKARTPGEVFEFCSRYNKLCEELGVRPPLMCVPTTYNAVKAIELFAQGFQIVVYANHLLRAAMLAMQRTAEILLVNDRSMEADEFCAPVADLFEISGYNEELVVEQMKNWDKSKGKVCGDKSH